jgi:superfamily II DNA/RNA helicase
MFFFYYDRVIATPGRFLHHIVETNMSLQRVEVIVFDEADRCAVFDIFIF